jgi:hypothetical protein
MLSTAAHHVHVLVPTFWGLPVVWIVLSITILLAVFIAFAALRTRSNMLSTKLMYDQLVQLTRDALTRDEVKDDRDKARDDRDKARNERRLLIPA